MNTTLNGALPSGGLAVATATGGMFGADHRDRHCVRPTSHPGCRSPSLSRRNDPESYRYVGDSQEWRWICPPNPTDIRRSIRQASVFPAELKVTVSGMSPPLLLAEATGTGHWFPAIPNRS